MKLTPEQQAAEDRRRDPDARHPGLPTDSPNNQSHPADGEKVVKLAHIDWTKDEDWSDVVLNGSFRHHLHHIGQNSCGNWFCRECSDRRIFGLSDDEVRRMLLQPRRS